jgi:hypothetical protein
VCGFSETAFAFAVFCTLIDVKDAIRVSIGAIRELVSTCTRVVGQFAHLTLLRPPRICASLYLSCLSVQEKM